MRKGNVGLSINITGLLWILATSTLQAQCDNGVQFPPGPSMSVVCGSNLISAAQWAGDYNLTKAYPDQSYLMFSSSVVTDFITIRKASDNTVLAFGVGQVSLVYDVSHDSLEMHINTNITCGTESINRTTSVFVSCGCSNNFQFPASTVSIQEGENTITTLQFAGDYHLTDSYENGAHCLFSSSVSSDFITIRRSSDNAILASGLTPQLLLYQSSFGELETHINTDVNCGTASVSRTTLVVHDTLEISESFTFKGGTFDGSQMSIFNKTIQSDHLAYLGGSGQGFDREWKPRSEISDRLVFVGNTEDGSHFMTVNKNPLVEVLCHKGGFGQGFASASNQKIQITESFVFTGGQADGLDDDELHNYNDLGLRGGQGDGFSFASYQGITLESFVYKGGSSDGFEQRILAKTEYAEILAFKGGGEDGSYKADLGKWVAIEPFAFNGSGGDGFSIDVMPQNFIAFKGGGDDGFHSGVWTAIVIENIVYNGGDGDGWNHESYGVSALPEIVFRGGSGNGWSRSFAGKLQFMDVITAYGGDGDGFQYSENLKNNFNEVMAALGGTGDGFGWKVMTKTQITESIVFLGGEGRGEDFSDPSCEGNTVWWNGAFDNSWHNPLNWSCQKLPDTNSIVIIRSGLARYPVVTQNTEIHSLVMQNLSSCMIEGNAVLRLNGG